MKTPLDDLTTTEGLKAYLDAYLDKSDRFGVTRFSKDMAAMFAHNNEDFHVRQLHLEWAVDEWAKLELIEYLPIFEQCYDGLVNLGKQVYNDLDNTAFVVRWPNARAFAVESQNYNYAYVKHDTVVGRYFTIYRYWHRPKKTWPHKQQTLKQLIAMKGTQYNDLRDEGWIASLSDIGTEHGMMGNYHTFIGSLFELDCLLTQIVEEHE